MASYIVGLLGLALLVGLLIWADVRSIAAVWLTAGWALLWLVPYRAGYLAFYAIGWQAILRPYDPMRRLDFGYVWWVTALREAVDRLLPVASVGGSMVGVRLLRWRGVALAPAGATVIIEIVLTLWASYFFAVIGVWLAVRVGGMLPGNSRLLTVLLFTSLVPLAVLLLLQRGSVFSRLQSVVARLTGTDVFSAEAVALDIELRACLLRRSTLLFAGLLQVGALMSASFEIWFALRLFGHPVSSTAALVLESLLQALRHVAFIVPAALGVQEAALVLAGHAFGINAELALAVSMAKRLHEILCGLPFLIAWQYQEGRRLRCD